MIDPIATQKELSQLADALRKQGDAISASRIEPLLIALGGDPSADDWAGANIQQIIDPAAIAEGLKSRSAPARGIGVLEWMRNALVLLPLTLTWLGISQAAEKYQELISHDSKQELHSFLFLWQTGFGGTLPKLFILNSLAFTDFSLLLVIFALTLITTWRQNIFTFQNEQQAELLRNRLAHALGDASLCLAHIHRENQKKQPSNLQDIARYLHQFGEDFKTTTDQFLREMESERKNRGDLTVFTAALDKMSKDMLSAANSIQQTNSSMTTALQDILIPAKEIPRIVMAASQAVSELNKMAGSLGQLVADQNKWRQELQTVLSTSLMQLVSDQNLSSQNLHTMLNTVLTQQTNQQARIGQELHTLMNTSFTQLLAEQKLLGTSLISSADELDKSTIDLAHTLQGFNKTASDQNQFLHIMQAMQTEQQRLTGEMATTTVEIKNVLKSVRESVPELRAMSIDIDRFVQALRSLPNALNADLLAPLQQYSSAAANYSSAAAKINAGADTLGRASQYFEQVTGKLDKRLGP